MENFEFFTPTRIIFGKNTYQQVGKTVKEYGFEKMLVHFGGASARESGLLDAVTGALEAERIQYVTLGGVQVGPTLAETREGIKLCLRKGVDLVLVVGEGSVIGSAECIADGMGNPDADVWTYSRQEAVPARALPVGVILALSTSGDEISASCVTTNGENGFKRDFNSMTRHPLFSICNPKLTYTTSRYQTTCSTVDIMMYTLERHFSRTRGTEPTDRIAEALLKSTVGAGKAADKKLDNYETRAALTWGDSLSHNGLTEARGSFFMQVHQSKHELSDMYLSIAHGVGLAALWPSWARLVCPGDMNHFTRYVIRVWSIDMDFDCPMSAALAGIRATEGFYKSLDIPSSLRELGMEEERLEKMAEKYTNMGKRTLSGIWELGKKEVVEIYRMAMGE